MAMKEIDRLVNKLFPEEGGDGKVIDLKFFSGEHMVTVEEFCRDVHAAFVQIDSGQSAALDTFDEDLKQVSLDRVLSGN
jgi:hypothetical protein